MNVPKRFHVPEAGAREDGTVNVPESGTLDLEQEPMKDQEPDNKQDPGIKNRQKAGINQEHQRRKRGRECHDKRDNQAVC